MFVRLSKLQLLLFICGCLFIVSCQSIHEVTKVPADTYFIRNSKLLNTAAPGKKSFERAIKAEVSQNDSVLRVKPLSETVKPYNVKLADIQQLHLYRYTFDVDILTIPFKVRPSVQGFPEQLNPNFSAALYLGRRKDIYTLQQDKVTDKPGIKLSGVGYGYGGFIGIGSVTMNSYVTQQKINYEYDGFVVNSGFAGIYDAKKFNIGLAIGADLLVDKNRHDWIYQGKPWFGVLFGVNLN